MDWPVAHRLSSRPICRPFFEQADAADDHVLVERFGHVVDRERGHADGGQRLHLNAGLTVAAHRGGDEHAAFRLIDLEVDRHFGQQQRVTERDQLRRAFRRHYAGDARGGEDISLRRGACADGRQRRRGHAHLACGYSRARRNRLIAHVHHRGAACAVEMGQRRHFVRSVENFLQ